MDAQNEPIVEFWYEFASTYSYPAVMTINERAKSQQVHVHWRPFLLGPIFFELGWTTSPFNLQPAKGQYMWRDLERTCAALGLDFHRPDPFPQSSLLACRIANVLETDTRHSFSQRVYTAEFAKGEQIDDPDVLSTLLKEIGCDPEEVLTAALAPENKDALKQTVNEAQSLGIFGAPMFVTPDRELFWGYDRMADALAWARRSSD